MLLISTDSLKQSLLQSGLLNLLYLALLLLRCLLVFVASSCSSVCFLVPLLDTSVKKKKRSGLVPAEKVEYVWFCMIKV